jgi:hypothetical protein
MSLMSPKEMAPDEFSEAFVSLMKRLKRAGIIKRLPRKGEGDDNIAFNPAYEKPLGGEGWVVGFAAMLAVIAEEGPLSEDEQAILLMMAAGSPPE